MPVTVFSQLIRTLRRFRADTAGTVAIEAVILLPLLFWTYLAMFSFFDMLRQQSLNQKASFTIADLVSRETGYVNDAYISNTFDLFRSMVRSDSTTSMRVSVLKWDGEDDRFEVDWSEARGPSSALTDSDVSGWTDRLPAMPSGEVIVLVETSTQYEIPFKIGMDDFEMNTFTFTRPRFSSQVCFSNDPDAINCVAT